MNALKFKKSPKKSQRFAQPKPGHKDWYAFEALRMIPRIILMIDKNKYSATYGCFDREFWHYRTVDFPCGMSQEFCLPLALAYKYPFPNNPYYQVERMKELVIASIKFSMEWSHPDGTCDDYFPFEKALGALVFSTYAMTESYLELELHDSEMVEFFKRRADWLSTHNETGQLANHQAFAALALYNVFLITGEEKYRKASDDFLELTLSWQHSEGWYQEYEGADPGYHSCSIAFLAKLWQKNQDPRIVASLESAVNFATYFMHPDGSYAGEYGSRNTYHFYPHGFEVMSRFFPDAGRIADTYLHRSMPERRRYFNDDNRMCAHYVYDWMQSWMDYHDERFGLLEDSREPFERWFDDAKIFVKKTGTYYAVLSLAKGGVIKVFDESGPLYSDTGILLHSEDGDTLVSHLVDDSFKLDARPNQNTFTATGAMARRRYPLPSPVKQMAFRGMNISVGRLGPNVVRGILQKVLITGKPRTEVEFKRVFEFGENTIVIKNEVDASASDKRFDSMATGSDATSIYVANSNTFQESVLLPWNDLDEHVATLNRQRKVDFTIELDFSAEE